jgi:GDP-L-fucose synthase
MKDSPVILILGANGLVGSAFWYGEKVSRHDADLTHYQDVVSLIKYIQPDWIINCAGYVGGVQANINKKWDFFNKNIQINKNVIEASMTLGVKNVISFLSTCIFPDDLAQSKSLEESDLHLGIPHDSNYPYAYSKRMIDVMSKIARDIGFNYSCLIPCNIYGFHDNYNLDSSHIIPALIHKFYLAYRKSIDNNSIESVEIWGSGKPIREFIFANDIPIIINQIIRKNLHFDNMIIAPETAISVKELAQKINTIFALKYLNTSADVTFHFNESKPDGQLKKTTNNSKFRSLIDVQLTNMDYGLSNTIDYFVDKYENERNNLKL